MSKIVFESQFRILLYGLPVMLGCSLVWDAEPISRPTHETGLCENREDDDQDGLLDCEDSDCAWHKVCLEQVRPYTTESCVYSERQLSDGFNTTTTTRTGGFCSNEVTTSSFGGNNMICGTSLIDRSQRVASPQFELRHWNVLAQSYCENVRVNVLEASFCDSTTDNGNALCDAPTLICVEDEAGLEQGLRCENYAVFLNGSRADGNPSGLVSRNLDLRMLQNDFFEADTRLRRLTRTVRTDGSSSSAEVIPCDDGTSCSDSCAMRWILGPKSKDVNAPEVELHVLVTESDDLQIRYEVRNLGAEVDDGSLVGDCGQVPLNEMGVGYGLRVAGPYFHDQGNGSVEQHLVVSAQFEEGWRGICHLPWDEIPAEQGNAEYELRYLRTGDFGLGKLLLDKVELKQRLLEPESHVHCGPSDVAIFQGGRTLCKPPVGTVTSVFAATTTTNGRARSLLLAKRDATQGYEIYEDKEGLLFILAPEDPEFILDGLTVVALKSVPNAEAKTRFRVWAENNSSELITMDFSVESIESDGQSKDVVRWYPMQAVTFSNSGSDPVELLHQRPSDIFWSAQENAFFQIGMTNSELVMARSTDGISDWQRTMTRMDWSSTVRSIPNLVDKTIVQVMVMPIPNDVHGRDRETLVVALGVRDEGSAAKSLDGIHLLTLLMDFDDPEASSLFYHQEIEVPPQMLVTERDLPNRPTAEFELSCPETSCLGYRGQSALHFNREKRLLTLFGKTTIDETFRPQRSPSPATACVDVTETLNELPQTQIWRRVELRLR